MKFFPTLRKDNSMMIMENKVLKMEDLQVDLVLEGCLIYLLAAERNLQAQGKENLSWLNFKSHYRKFSTERWKISASKGILFDNAGPVFANLVKEKVVKIAQSVEIAKEQDWLRKWCN